MADEPTPTSPASPGSALEWTVDRGVGTVTLARPDVLNALTFETYAALSRLLRDLRDDDDVRAVVLTGRGRGFCSGSDVEGVLGALLDCDVRDVVEFTRLAAEVVEGLRRLDRPVVAAINGVAAGAGAAIALACDLRVMAQGAKFHLLFAKVGLAAADMGIAWLLPRIVGLGRAAEILLLGEPVEAERALEIGMVNRVVPRERVLAEATAMARRLAEGPTLALGATKRLLVHEASVDFGSAVEMEALAQALLLRAKDHRNFYDAYRTGSETRFEGR